MKDKTDKEKLALLQAQSTADRAKSDAAMAAAAAPKPLTTTISKETQDYLDQTSGKNGPVDINNITAMKPNLALYGAASQRQQGERMGRGAIQLGAQNTNPGLGQLLREQQDAERQQAAAGGLENAYRLTDVSMRGNILPLIGLEQQKSMGLAGLASNQSQNSTNQYANFRPAPSIWQQLLLTGVGGASAVGQGMATGGTGFFKP